MSDAKNYDAMAAQAKWSREWEEKGTYRYDPARPRNETFVIDTPPPTVSGSLHIGHAFSYTQTDILARFKRMNGFNVYYPMGWDDNGLPTERRVQNLFGITCDPMLASDPAWKPELAIDPKLAKKPVSRRNFLDACATQTTIDEKKYEALWRTLGLSIDWRQQYATIDEHCRKISQLSFLDLAAKRQVYSIEAPTLWDTGFQTAVAQAEVEERSKQGFFHDLRFHTESGESFVISTTRPELLPACIAVVAHPEDARFKHLFGQTAITPLFKAPVPILPSEHADPEKGTGILMVCTFGDIHDVEFWKKSKLPLKQIIGRDGRLLTLRFGEGAFESRDLAAATENYAFLQGLTVNQARTQIVQLLRASSDLVSEPRQTEQAVKFYEKGDYPLEFVSTRQWFIKILEHKTSLLEQGRKIKWHPEFMLKRYEQWVEGLNQDWCISRQRYFGVPFPVWYPIDKSGAIQYDKPIFAREDQLPIDPLAEPAPGFAESMRGKAGGFIGDPDVMDTWATSSVTPQINSHWKISEQRHPSLFPADLRPQAHEIIRTWAFYTIVKSWLHEGKIPWKNIAISGWVVDPNRDKMSKSKGNVVTPDALIEKYSADGIRYWAGRAKLGQDTIYDETIFQTGKRLATKILNASKFVMLQLGSEPLGLSATDITHPLDRAWVKKMNDLILAATSHLSEFDYAQALIEIEQRFWDFCDVYIELVKARAYQQKSEPGGRSALATLEWTLKTFLRLFAPFLPYVCEEIWSWRFAQAYEQDSIHRTMWPQAKETEKQGAPSSAAYDTASTVLSEIRSAKSAARRSLKWPIEILTIEIHAGSELALLEAKPDIVEAGGAKSVVVKTGASELKVIVQLASE
jgi:valyl-tRNA synthetase